LDVQTTGDWTSPTIGSQVDVKHRLFAALPMMTAELSEKTQFPVWLLQLSAVQTLLSLQTFGVLIQTPVSLLQESAVHTLLSSQDLRTLMHFPVTSLQESTVQALLSSQEIGVEMHFPVRGSQVAGAHLLPEQIFGVKIQPVSCLHVSIVQALLSSQLIAVLIN